MQFRHLTLTDKQDYNMNMNHSRALLNEARAYYAQAKTITAMVRRNDNGRFNGHDLSNMLNQCKEAKRDLRKAIAHTEDMLEASKQRKIAQSKQRRIERMSKAVQRRHDDLQAQGQLKTVGWLR